MDRMQADETALSQLDAGEHLLWSGAPDPGRLALQALPAMLFGVPFTAFAAFWMTMAFRMTGAGSHPASPGPFFALFGLPFLLIGLAILTSPLWTYLGAQRTVYAVTEHRALIISGLGTRGVQSFTHADIGDLERFERADGSGDLYFAARGYVTRGVARMQRLGFIGIPEVRTVEQLIRSHLQSEAA